MSITLISVINARDIRSGGAEGLLFCDGKPYPNADVKIYAERTCLLFEFNEIDMKLFINYGCH